MSDGERARLEELRRAWEDDLNRFGDLTRRPFLSRVDSRLRDMGCVKVETSGLGGYKVTITAEGLEALGHGNG